MRVELDIVNGPEEYGFEDGQNISPAVVARILEFELKLLIPEAIGLDLLYLIDGVDESIEGSKYPPKLTLLGAKNNEVVAG